MTKEEKQRYYDLYSGQEVITTDGEIFMTPSEYRDMVAHVPEHNWTEYYAVLKDVKDMPSELFTKTYRKIGKLILSPHESDQRDFGYMAADITRAAGYFTSYANFTEDQIIEWGIVKIKK